MPNTQKILKTLRPKQTMEQLRLEMINELGFLLHRLKHTNDPIEPLIKTMEMKAHALQYQFGKTQE